MEDDQKYSGLTFVKYYYRNLRQTLRQKEEFSNFFRDYCSFTQTMNVDDKCNFF